MKKILPFFFLFAVLTLFIISCNKQNSTGSFTYTMLKGQCISSANGNNFSICLDSVGTDSRCPTGAVCFRAGDVFCMFSFHQNGIVIPFALSIGEPYSRHDTLINQITISLKDVLPYPSATTPPSMPTQAIIEVTE